MGGVLSGEGALTTWPNESSISVQQPTQDVDCPGADDKEESEIDGDPRFQIERQQHEEERKDESNQPEDDERDSKEDGEETDADGHSSPGLFLNSLDDVVQLGRIKSKQSSANRAVFGVATSV